jgi:hypothetical protein
MFSWRAQRYRTKQSPASYDPEIDWKGSLGPNLQGFNAGAYDYRLFTTFGYNLGDFGANLRWRYLPEVVVTQVRRTKPSSPTTRRWRLRAKACA